MSNHNHKLSNVTELLAPAGSPAAGYAALAYGADAVYLGLQKFSARADADNFDFNALSDFVGFAHQLPKYRKVYVTMNTLLKDNEMADVIETLQFLEEIGIDAIITQDLALVYLCKNFFPKIPLHASTQMAIHNYEGALAVKEMGFERVVLAREITLDEIKKIVKIPDLELEIFIHGALCYAYSGLCLLSSMLRGRSGNRGSCAYNCRNGYHCRNSAIKKERNADSYVMSMKDLCLDEVVNELAEIGVASLKIEGRKKSPTYVSAAVDYYRAILDYLPQEIITQRHQNLETIFSRPQTHFFMDNVQQNVVEANIVGHLGTSIGTIEKYIPSRFGDRPDIIRFTTSIDLMVYDGLQLPIPDNFGKPYGFSIDKLIPIIDNEIMRPVFEVTAGSTIEVTLPKGHPHINVGTEIFCSSSQKVKQAYDFETPKPGLYKLRTKLDIEITMAEAGATITGTCGSISQTVTVNEPLTPAKNPDGVTEAINKNISKLGDTKFVLNNLKINNPSNLFAPASLINQWRRELTSQIENSWEQNKEIARKEILSKLPKGNKNEIETSSFIVKIDNLDYLPIFTNDSTVSEIIIDIAAIDIMEFRLIISNLQQSSGDKFRLALPVITKENEEKELITKINIALQCKIKKWQICNLSGFKFLEKGENLDITTDASIPTTNSLSATYLLKYKQCTRITIPAETTKQEIDNIVAIYPQQAEVILYQNTILAYSQSCIHANENGGCVGKKNCTFRTKTIVSNKGEVLIAYNQNCRTIITNSKPFSLVPYIEELKQSGCQVFRCDFCYQSSNAEEMATLWNKVKNGTLTHGYQANYDRELL